MMNLVLHSNTYCGGCTIQPSSYVAEKKGENVSMASFDLKVCDSSHFWVTNATPLVLNPI